MMFLYDFKLLNPTSEDLTIALKWVSQQDSKHNLDLQGITEIIDQIMFTAFKYLDNKNVLEEYKNAVIHITKNYDEVVGNKLQDSFYKMYEEEDEKKKKIYKINYSHTVYR
ncbi:MAG: hypothetical protein H6613_16445 [Ignavibacteriales bacterium]|nr:hypothetical protein [Ignavibacteriales bacterium]